MTDKLSEKLRNTRAEAFPNTTVGNTTMDIWIDLAENLEQRVERLEGAVKSAFVQLDIEPEWGWQYVEKALASQEEA